MKIVLLFSARIVLSNSCLNYIINYIFINNYCRRGAHAAAVGLFIRGEK